MKLFTVNHKLVRIFALVLALVLVLSFCAFWALHDAKLSFLQAKKDNGSLFPANEAAKTDLAAVGDIMLSRKVGRLIFEEGNMYPWENIGGELRASDVLFGNLESPLSDRGEPLPGKGIWFRADPGTVQGLKDTGFDVVSIANNHSLDYQKPAFKDTIELLKSSGIKPVGGGANLQEARKPVFVQKSGLEIVFLAYSDMADIYWSHSRPRRLKATGTTAGIAPLDRESMLEDISRVRQQADIVVVSLHWGVEYQRYPTNEQRKLAYELVEEGADIIIGHHPHVFQGLEIHGQGIIAYSLGNFVFDQAWGEATQEGLLVKFRLTSIGCTEAKVYPVVLPRSQPRIAQGEDAERILEELKLLSSNLGTDLELQEGKGLVGIRQ